MDLSHSNFVFYTKKPPPISTVNPSPFAFPAAGDLPSHPDPPTPEPPSSHSSSSIAVLLPPSYPVVLLSPPSVLLPSKSIAALPQFPDLTPSPPSSILRPPPFQIHRCPPSVYRPDAFPSSLRPPPFVLRPLSSSLPDKSPPSVLLTDPTPSPPPSVLLPPSVPSFDAFTAILLPDLIRVRHCSLMLGDSEARAKRLADLLVEYEAMMATVSILSDSSDSSKSRSTSRTTSSDNPTRSSARSAVTSPVTTPRTSAAIPTTNAAIPDVGTFDEYVSIGSLLDDDTVSIIKFIS